MHCSLTATNISKQFHSFFRKPQLIINNFEINAHAGEIIALLGGNGAGKTTALKLLCGLIRPSTGKIIVCGHDLHAEREKAVFYLGAVFEGGRSLHWQLSVWENMLYYGRLKGRSLHEVERSAKKLLEQMNLWTCKDTPAGQFSRGIQQQLSLATILVANPSVILLDEPTLGLDTEALEQLRTWLSEIAHKEKKIIIIATHHIELVASIATHVVLMQNGIILNQQPSHELFKYPHKEKYRLQIRETTSVNAIFRKFNIHNYERHAELLVLEFLPTQTNNLSELCFELQKHNVALVSIEQIVPSLTEMYTQAMNQRILPL